MKSIFLICASLIFSLQLASAQDCKVNINNIRFQNNENLYGVSFTFGQAGAYEINLYDSQADQFLIDESNIRPFEPENTIRVRIAGSRISISGISNNISKKSLKLVLVRKDKSCKPVKVDLR